MIIFNLTAKERNILYIHINNNNEVNISLSRLHNDKID